MEDLRGRLPDLTEQQEGRLGIQGADEFSYGDSVDGSTSSGQGIRVCFDSGGRVVFRLSGTGTEGATLRVDLEQLETAPDRLHRDPQEALAPIIAAADALAGIAARTGRSAPDVVT